MTLSGPYVPPHPAKFSEPILGHLRVILYEESKFHLQALQVLDPMAGVGRIHELQSRYIRTTGVELEPEWAAAHPRTKAGNALRLTKIFPRKRFDVTVTSPCYGNRMADHHDAKDASKRMTYRHTLGRELTAGSGAGLQWGPQYQFLHVGILRQMIEVTKPGGLIIVNASNHVRHGAEQLVAEWWLQMMLQHHLKLVAVKPIETRRMGFGANRNVRVDREWILSMRKSA